MQLVILAGGKGTRLGLTDIPKPMCPIAGKPLLERQIELAKTYGFDEILFCPDIWRMLSAIISATVRVGALRFIISLKTSLWALPVL